MDCEKVIAQLSGYYDGESGAALAKDVETHLATCKVCASELSNFEAISGMLKSTDSSKIAACATAPSWEQFASRLDAPISTRAANSEFNSRRMLAFAIGTVALAASILLIVRLTTRTNSDSVDHTHTHTHSLANNADIAIDFEKLLDESIQPVSALKSLSKTFEGREAAIDESETELGYKPSISQALPSGVKLVSNHVLKLPQCNCVVGECSCGPRGCNCAACLCKRVDGSEFLVVEHCETQNVSFGHLHSELVNDDKGEVQMMNVGNQMIASWISHHRRLTAIGLNGKSEALALVASVGSR